MPYDPAIPLLGIYPDKTIIQEDTCIPQQPRPGNNLNTYYSAIEKNEIMPFAATQMDLEIITPSEVKSQRERQIPYDIIYMQNLKYNINEHSYETETDSQT